MLGSVYYSLLISGIPEILMAHKNEIYSNFINYQELKNLEVNLTVDLTQPSN